jgi:hypothetical protein
MVGDWKYFNRDIVNVPKCLLAWGNMTGGVGVEKGFLGGGWVRVLELNTVRHV